MNEVVSEILWTNSGKRSFHNIIEYLRKEWSEAEVEKFLTRVDDFIITLKKYPEMCRPSLKRKNVRIGILDKHTQIIYHFTPGKSQIKILLFWGMKQNPSKLRY